MNTNAVYVFATWQVKDGQTENVLSLLKEVAEASRNEKGNLFYKIHQSIADRNTIVLSEGYADQTAVNEHRDSPHFKEIVIGKIVPLLEKREVVATNEIAE
ncbi:putative quinol monooxygenase [Pollutibacter soli]|uniref:putative quinol monooxygenase n=1 Tax=Pollutibacter soli TaxID=3034157 RepID=UPI0030131F2E